MFPTFLQLDLPVSHRELLCLGLSSAGDLGSLKLKPERL